MPRPLIALCLSLLACGRAEQPFRWRAAAPSPIARFEAMGAAAAGKLVLMGGFTDSSLAVTARVDLYDPAIDLWSQSIALPGAQTHVAVAARGGELVLAGGFTGPASSWHTTAEVWIRAADGSFRAGPALPSPRAAATAAVLGQSVHVVGGLAADGNSDSGEHVVSDLTGPFRQLNALPNARNHLGGAAIGGLLYAVAGRHGWDENAGDQSDLSVFDPASQVWTLASPIAQPVSEIGGSTFAAEGRLVVIGGSVAGVHPTARVWSYDPGEKAWSSLPDLPEPRKGAAAVAIGKSVIVTTGSPTSVDPSATTWVGCCLP